MILIQKRKKNQSPKNQKKIKRKIMIVIQMKELKNLKKIKRKIMMKVIQMEKKKKI